MMKDPRVILLEFNELSPTLMDRFISQGHLPYFRRFRDEAQLFVTDAEAEPANLEPWIQWVTVHSGLTAAEHGLYHLDEGHTLATRRIWDLLSESGREVWVCGSMNVRYDANLCGAVLPDPWCTHVAPRPDELQKYFTFVQRNVLEYSNAHQKFKKSDYLRFATFMTTHGLSTRTVASILRQVNSERNGHNRWKRATLLDELQFDLFASYYRRRRPQFATFFLNSTAHYQHSYWRSMEPEAFPVKESPETQREYQSAVLFGYQKMDAILGRFMALAGDHTTLIFCTALSQQPCLKYEAQGGANFYRPKDFSVLARFAGLQGPFTAAPVMTHQFNVEFTTEADACDAEKRLKAVHADGHQALSVERSGNRVFTGCQLYRGVADRTMLSLQDSDRSTSFDDIFYRLDALKSGMHHPDGLLWIRTPDRTYRNTPERVPLSGVAPTVLRLFGLERPPYMKSGPLKVI